MIREGLLLFASALEYMAIHGNNALSQSVIDRIEDERWGIPLSEKYPNLTGVTDEDIENFKENIRRKLKRSENERENYKKRVQQTYEDIIERDYLRYVKMLTREEIYEIARKLGREVYHQTDGTAFDKDTIYITSPRGGYEFLSIYSYANDTNKVQIPSDIQEDVSGTFGINWLYDVSHIIKTVVIVDDIIASGEQIFDMVSVVRKMINPEKIIPVYIAMREWRWKVASYVDDDVKVDVKVKEIYDSVIYGIKTIGIRKWRKKKNPDPEKDIITVGFPWSIADGESDIYLKALYGGRSYRKRRWTEEGWR